MPKEPQWIEHGVIKVITDKQMINRLLRRVYRDKKKGITTGFPSKLPGLMRKREYLAGKQLQLENALSAVKRAVETVEDLIIKSDPWR